MTTVVCRIPRPSCDVSKSSTELGVDLVFETHSKSLDNERGIATGWLPGELSAEGRTLAVALGVRRRDVDVVYVSDLRRAVETAELAFAGTKIPVFRDARLRECNYGELNGATVTAMEGERPRGMEDAFHRGESYRH